MKNKKNKKNKNEYNKYKYKFINFNSSICQLLVQ
jgi:hypothetical protein